MVHLKGDLPLISSEIGVIVSYRISSEDVGLRMVRKTAQLPLKMMLRNCPPENAAIFTTVLKRNDPLVGLNQLFPGKSAARIYCALRSRFPEWYPHTVDLTAIFVCLFTLETLNPCPLELTETSSVLLAEFTENRTQGQRQNWNALGMRHIRNGYAVTIVSGNASNRYRVQSSDGLSTTLVVQQLISRLEEKSAGGLSASIGQNHLRLAQSRIEAHFLTRKKIEGITVGQ